MLQLLWDHPRGICAQKCMEERQLEIMQVSSRVHTRGGCVSGGLGVGGAGCLTSFLHGPLSCIKSSEPSQALQN